MREKSIKSEQKKNSGGDVSVPVIFGTVSLQTKKRVLFGYDIAAICLGASLFILFVLTAHLGIPSTDEGNYYCLTQRLLGGERLFAELWDLSQMSYLLDVPFHWLYIKITGGTDGLILFMRYVFIGIDLLVYAFACRRLRFLRWSGVLSAFFLCAVVPQTIFALAYFTQGVFAFSAVCLVLIVDQRRKGPFCLFLTGVILALAVMAQPFLLFVYVFFAFAVFSRMLMKPKRLFFERYAWFLNGRVFLWVSVGAGLVFAVFMSYLAISGSLQLLPSVLPQLLSGQRYNKSNLLDLNKLSQAVSFFGTVPVVLLGVCLLAASVLFFLKRYRPVRMGVFVCSCVLLTYCYGHVLYGIFVHASLDLLFYINYQTFLTLLASVIWTLLCAQRAPCMLAVCSAGVLYSLAVDTASYSLLGTGGVIAQIAGFWAFEQNMRELWSVFKETAKLCKMSSDGIGVKGAGKTHFATAVSCAVAGLCLFTVLIWNGAFIATETVHKPIEYCFSRVFSVQGNDHWQRIDVGPYKGLKTTDRLAGLYMDTLADLDLLRKNGNGEPLMVPADMPFIYLYLNDQPRATYGSWYDHEIDRLSEYWRLFPEKTPKVLYVPAYDSFFYASLGEGIVSITRSNMVKGIKDKYGFLGSFDIVYGKAGILIYISN